MNEVVEKYKPEIIFHLAAQPLVRDSYDNPVYTYQTNVI
jgi:CDP-glucose 4,6-dehydratase